MKSYKLTDWFAPAALSLGPDQTIDTVWDKLVKFSETVAKRAHPDLPWDTDDIIVVITRFGERLGEAWVLGQLAVRTDLPGAKPVLAASAEDDLK